MGLKTSASGEILRGATRLVEAGKIMPQFDHRHFTLETVCDAYRAIKTGPVAAKIVVDVKPRSTNRKCALA